MIRDDFKLKGFPIGNRNPVITIDKDGKWSASYTRAALKSSITMDTVACVGVWAGSSNSDCFVLNPASYSKVPIPPEEFEDIDNALSIKVIFSNKVFDRVCYAVENDQRNDNSIIEKVSKDSRVLDYITEIGLRFSKVYE